MDHAEKIAAIAALEIAIAQGARRVIFHSGGTRREVEYFSLAEMRQQLELLKQQLRRTPRVILAAL
jgi:hypothetical protein